MAGLARWFGRAGWVRWLAAKARDRQCGQLFRKTHRWVIVAPTMHLLPPHPRDFWPPFQCADLRPGMAVSATVNRVEEYGLLVSVTSSIRCGCS